MSTLIECPKCGWVHFAVSEEYVRQWEADWKHAVETRPKEWLANYGVTDTPPSREQYQRCFRCGNRDTNDFFLTNKDVAGRTIQPILWERP